MVCSFILKFKQKKKKKLTPKTQKETVSGLNNNLALTFAAIINLMTFIRELQEKETESGSSPRFQYQFVIVDELVFTCGLRTINIQLKRKLPAALSTTTLSLHLFNFQKSELHCITQMKCSVSKLTDYPLRKYFIPEVVTKNSWRIRARCISRLEITIVKKKLKTSALSKDLLPLLIAWNKTIWTYNSNTVESLNFLAMLLKWSYNITCLAQLLQFPHPGLPVMTSWLPFAVLDGSG